MFMNSGTELNENFEFCLKIIHIPNWMLILVPKLSTTCVFYCETHKSVNTRNIHECYCVARKKPIRRKITKPQRATITSLQF